MGEWVDTEYGRRYMENYGSCVAFFMTKPDEDGNRVVPADVLKILMMGEAGSKENDST